MNELGSQNGSYGSPDDHGSRKRRQPRLSINVSRNDPKN